MQRSLFWSVALLASLWAQPIFAEVRETRLTIAREDVTIDGRTVEAMTVDGGIPGPTLRWKVGDLARIHVTNTMDVPSSVHWHGLILPNRQDGVPGLTSPAILPGATLTYEIPVRHAGTYWYHSHTRLQEQRGVYGSIVIEPAERRSDVTYDRDVVVVLSDWTASDPNEILRLLKRGSEYFSIEKGTAQSLWGAFRRGALGDWFRRALGRMPPMDISDVAYDAFLSNGQPTQAIPARPGERLRVRVVNAAASTYFYLGLGTGPLRVIAADGMDVQPHDVDRLLMAIAETYDFVVEVPDDGRVELRATTQDGSGQTSTWIGSGPDIPASDVPRPNLYVMRHGNHGGHRGHDDGSGASDPSPHAGHGGHAEHSGHTAHADHSSHTAHADHSAHPAPSGHADHAPPAGHREHAMRRDHGGPEIHTGHPVHPAMARAPKDPRPLPPYPELQATKPTTLPKSAPRRSIKLRLTGNMQRYVWSFDGKILSEADLIEVRKGEVLRVELENTTMMHHPLHLHGHFFRVLDGDDSHAPLKHTVDVPPMQTVTLEFLADADKDWFFHCHVLYHMKAGMARVFHYEGSEPDADLAELRATVLTANPWYAWAQASLLSSHTEGLITASNSRHELATEWEIGWQRTDGVDTEVLPYYRYHFNRLYRVMAGVSVEDPRTVGIFGAEAVLPLNFNARAWVDTRGDVRLALDQEVMLTSRLGIEGEVEWDSDLAWEGSAGLRLLVSRYGSLAFGWHSEFGFGGGVELLF